MGQKVWSHRLDIALVDTGQSRKDLEVLFGAPALGQGRERDVDSSHCPGLTWEECSWKEKAGEGGELCA